MAEARLSRFFDAAPSAASTKATRNILKGPLVLRLVEYVGCRTERDQFPRVHERSIARYACRLQHVVGDTDDCELEYFDQFLDTGRRSSADVDSPSRRTSSRTAIPRTSPPERLRAARQQLVLDLVP